MKVQTFKNHPVDSNCYVVFDEDCKSCIIIDPGTNESSEIIEFIESKKLIIDYVILTHEHFDHIWGVNALVEFADPIIIASQYCANMVKDKRKNLSLFHDQLGFVIYKEIKSVENLKGAITWGKHIIKFINTPGHSESSISVYINQCLFSGDLMIKDLKTVTKLPTGNKNKLLHSLELIKKNFSNRNIIVYPGHGDFFLLDDINLNSFL
jgi:glyoxylase-like metal-dependent hydrolase (beta-lactamase superfamily II)